VTQLVAFEFRRTHSLLFDELLLGARDLAPVEAWRLQDDLDREDYGGSWLTDERNAEVIAGSQYALLRHIEENAHLRYTFVRTATNGGGRDGNGGGRCLCPKAMAIYEAHVQQFLSGMAVLMHVPPGPPLRAPELLSITYINTGRGRRSVMIWEKAGHVICTIP
jgi:hypothetical protein